ncbi:SDR family oxidoreductase [Cognatilysobacter lacus]|uniref:SDR family oxidoreductase n=1 Tax=Cognatilysobacter lacus TaxID=1643323 RepID=A0A5D8Z7X5_9GAMM|nr:SDR family oxidoreductase [Lysobacter lacus]TZF90232.1 SDR family oxidoreductase [Lysobacter lacus]
MSRRNSLVTGANRGLGLEYCRQLLARGDHVIATARHPAQAHELNRLAADHPGRLHVLPLDVTDPKAEAEIARELPLVLGDEPLHLLINNAGLLHSGERFGHVAAANLEDSFRTNAMGPFLLTQALAPRLAEGATVANMSSQLGSIAGTTRFGTPTYCITKAALNMATRLLAAALADRGIRVVSLHPGWVATDMGGEQAPLAPAQSVEGLLKVLDGVGMSQSGSFLDWQGKVLPW